jgi:hypothetical protein
MCMGKTGCLTRGRERRMFDNEIVELISYILLTAKKKIFLKSKAITQIPSVALCKRENISPGPAWFSPASQETSPRLALVLVFSIHIKRQKIRALSAVASPPPMAAWLSKRHIRKHILQCIQQHYSDRSSLNLGLDTNNNYEWLDSNEFLQCFHR